MALLGLYIDEFDLLLIEDLRSVVRMHGEFAHVFFLGDRNKAEALTPFDADDTIAQVFTTLVPELEKGSNQRKRVALERFGRISLQ